MLFYWIRLIVAPFLWGKCEYGDQVRWTCLLPASCNSLVFPVSQQMLVKCVIFYLLFHLLVARDVISIFSRWHSPPPSSTHTHAHMHAHTNTQPNQTLTNRSVFPRQATAWLGLYSKSPDFWFPLLPSLCPSLFVFTDISGLVISLLYTFINICPW